MNNQVQQLKNLKVNAECLHVNFKKLFLRVQ
jgi:hypothetical protein